MSEKKKKEEVKEAVKKEVEKQIKITAVAELDELREHVKEVSANLEYFALALHTMTRGNKEADALTVNVRVLDQIADRMGELCKVFEGGGRYE